MPDVLAIAETFGALAAVAAGLLCTAAVGAAVESLLSRWWRP